MLIAIVLAAGATGSLAALAVLERSGRPGRRSSRGAAWLTHSWARLTDWVEQASLPWPPGTFLRLTALALAALALACSLLLGWLPGLAVAALAGWLLRLYLAGRIARRAEYVAGELPAYLQMVAGSLRSGFSLLQSLEIAAGDGPPLISAEIQRLIHEVNMGTSLEEALDRLARRCANDDLELFVSAVLLSREVGGDLSEILAALQETIRERGRLRRQVQVLTAQARLSGLVLSLLPPVLLTMAAVISPAYAQVLRENPLGWLLILSGLGSQGIGIWLIRRILRSGEDLLT